MAKKKKVARIKYIGPGNYWVVKVVNKHLLKGSYENVWFRKVYFDEFQE